MKDTKTSRRDFLKIIPSVVVGCAAATVPAFSFLKDASAQNPSASGAPTTAVDADNDMMAKTLGYVHDATKADVVKFPKRAGAEGAKQFCNNCVLMTQGGLKVAGKEGDWGKCALFQTGLVNVNGWCNSWAPKA